MNYTRLADYNGWWSAFKKYYRTKWAKRVGITGKTPKSMRIFISEILDESAKDNTRSNMFAGCIRGFSVYVSKFCNMTHIFLGHGVAEFCANSIQDIKPEYMKAIPNGERVGSRDWFEGVPIAIHAPAGEMEHSVLVVAGITNDKQRKPYTSFMYSKNGGECLFEDSFVSLGSEYEHYAARVALGVFLYMDAFPELVGEPEIMTKVGGFGYRGNSVLVQPCSIIDDENRHAVSPHFRRGHFRFLQSDRYTKKRFQTVFVKGCFVRGTAKTVKAIA